MNPRIRANRKSILLFLSVLDYIIQELREKVETVYSKQHHHIVNTHSQIQIKAMRGSKTL